MTFKAQDTIRLSRDSTLIAVYDTTEFVFVTIAAEPPEANEVFPFTLVYFCGNKNLVTFDLTDSIMQMDEE
jgi:hypothetical protein